MNEEVQNQLLEWARSAVSIANQQIPDLAEQYLRWSLYTNIISVILWVTAFGITAKFAVQCNKGMQKNDDYVPGFVLGCIVCVVLLLGVGDSVYDLIKVIAAPKLYLLDYVVHSHR